MEIHFRFRNSLGYDFKLHTAEVLIVQHINKFHYDFELHSAVCLIEVNFNELGIETCTSIIFIPVFNGFIL